MKQALLRRIKKLEQNKETAGNWELTLTAIVEGTVIPPGATSIPLRVIDTLLQDTGEDSGTARGAV